MNSRGVIAGICAYLFTVIKGWYDESVLCKIVAAISRFLLSLPEESLFIGMLVSESLVSENAARHSLAAKLWNRAEGFSKSKAGAEHDAGWIVGNICHIIGSIPSTTCRSFGLMLAAFGIVSAVLKAPSSGIWFYLCIGAALCGFVMIMVNRSFHNMFGGSKFARFCGGFFGFENICEKSMPVVSFNVFYTIAGLLLGAAFGILDLQLFIIGAGAVIGGILVMYKTEVGVYAAAFLIPLAPTKIILGIAAVTVLSYFVKIFIIRRGELPLSFGKLDLLALLFAAVLVYSTVISYRIAGSFIVAATYILYILFFISVKNSLRTKRMIYAAISLLALSGLAVAAFGIYQRLTGQFVETISWIDDTMFSEATSRIYSTLENPNPLGEYLIFVIMIALGMLYYQKKPLYLLAVLGILGAAVLCMVFTQSRGAWLGLLFALAMFALMHDRRLVILGIAGIIILPAVLPMSIMERFLSIGNLTDSSTSYRVNIWLGCLIMLKTTWLTGIGTGEASFRHVYQEYAFNATEAPHSHNLFLQVIIENGVIGLIVLLLLLGTFFKYMFTGYRRTKDRFIRAVSASLASAMFGYLVQGLTDNAWYNYRVVAYFWFVIAICGALHILIKEGDFAYGQAN